MRHSLYLASRYLRYHRIKTGILIVSITLILYLPVALRVLVDRSSDELTARALATPLVVGAKGSALELVLNSLYFDTKPPQTLYYEQLTRMEQSGLSLAIPLYARFASQGHPIVGTSLDYLEFRGLALADGRRFGMLGECVIGAKLAREEGIGVGDAVVSSPESVFDLAGVYPLKMNVVGVLAPSHTPDDRAIFVDVKTAWVIQGLGHGHQDLSTREAAGAVLSREEGRIVANASLVEYNEITDSNIDSFHFHGDLSGYPLTAALAVPYDQKSGVILQGRYQGEDEVCQIVRPVDIMDELLETILTIQRFVIAAVALVSISTVATAVLVFLLSLRLRKREIATMDKIGGSRGGIVSLIATEIGMVLLISAALAGGLTLLTSRFGELLIRAFIL